MIVQFKMNGPIQYCIIINYQNLLIYAEIREKRKREFITLCTNSEDRVGRGVVTADIQLHKPLGNIFSGTPQSVRNVHRKLLH